MKKYGFSLLISVFFFLTACRDAPTEQPTLSDDKLAHIMADLSIADAATNGLAGYKKDSLMHVYVQQVFELHRTTLEAYEKDLKLLSLDLPRMEKIVHKAEDILTEAGNKPEAN